MTNIFLRQKNNMFCSCTLFSGNAQTNSHFKFGGPRRLYKFKHRNTTIIVIGSTHGKLRAGYAQEYSTVVNRVAKEQPTKLFLNNENRHDDDFFDCINALSEVAKMPPNLSQYNEDFLGYIRFLNLTVELTNLTARRQIAAQCKKEFSMADYSRFVEYHLDQISELSQKYLAALGVSLDNLYLYLSDSYMLVNQIEDEYKENKNVSLIKRCIKRPINYSKELLTLQRRFTVSCLAVELLDDLLDQIKNETAPSKTFIVVTEKSHANDLAELLKTICSLVSSNKADKNSVITPNTLMDFISPRSFRNRCSIM